MRWGGEVEARKMFGDYGVYCNGKIFALVSDNGFYVKPTCAELPDPKPKAKKK